MKASSNLRLLSKRYAALAMIAGSLLLSSTGCRKTEEAIVDCLSENILTSLKHNISETDPKQLNLEASYNGDKTVSQITWTFGDGSTTTTTTRTTSHTYSTAGTYQVKADISLDNGACVISPKKSITIQ